MSMRCRLTWVVASLLIFYTVPFCQSKDSLLLNDYSKYKNGVFNDSTLSALYHAGLISRDQYLNRLYGRTSLDSIRLADLRSHLKYKFIIDYLSRVRPDKQYFDDEMERNLNHFVINTDKPEGALESFGYYLEYDLYTIESIGERNSLYLLAASDINGLVKLFLFDDAEHQHTLLDTLDLYPENDPEINFVQINGQDIIRLRQTIHGSGYLDEQEILVGVVGERFHDLFKTDLLQANNWGLSPSDTSNDFDRWTAKIRYVDVNGDGMLDIEKEVSEDVISMDGVKDFDFASGRVIKHVRSWIEIYIWDRSTDFFMLNKKLSKAASRSSK